MCYIVHALTPPPATASATTAKGATRYVRVQRGYGLLGERYIYIYMYLFVLVQVQ